MKVLLVGAGGREHALAWRLAQDKEVKSLYCAPGNPGTAEVAENVAIEADDLDGLARFARRQRIDLTIAGPEAPLVAGINERFEQDGLLLFGPSKRAAELEGSKVFAKQLMRRFGIPTAEFRIFDNPRQALNYVHEAGVPLVVKADGLAAGKGVIVTSTPEEAAQAVRLVMEQRAFGDAGRRIVIEERLVGEEASILAVTDGKTILPLPASQDHKQVYDGDRGPNTGGMGAYAPAPLVDDKLTQQITSDFLVPTVHAMQHLGRPYIGVLYVGLIATSMGPRVLEYNCRFGDPETQPIMLLLEGSLAETLYLAAAGKLDEAKRPVFARPGAAVCVVLASGGYPGNYRKGLRIDGLEDAGHVEGVTVFHAGTRWLDGALLTAGGRVLGVTAKAADIAEARTRAYQAVEKIHFEGVHYRTDIGLKALRRPGSGP